MLLVSAERCGLLIAVGLVPVMVLVIADLADRAEAIGSDIGDARVDMARADSEILTADARGRLNHAAFQNLCAAYEKIMFGVPQARAHPANDRLRNVG